MNIPQHIDQLRRLNEELKRISEVFSGRTRCARCNRSIEGKIHSFVNGQPVCRCCQTEVDRIFAGAFGADMEEKPTP